MGFLIDRLKLKAAASSMHQFCPVVRGVFPDEADNKVVESITLFLYLNLAKDVFGPRFTKALGRRLCAHLKFTTPCEARTRLGRFSRRAGRVRSTADSMLSHKTPELMFQNHIASVVHTMLSEAGQDPSDSEERAQAFERFDATVRRMKEHLIGIRKQNHFLMT